VVVAAASTEEEEAAPVEEAAASVDPQVAAVAEDHLSEVAVAEDHRSEVAVVEDHRSEVAAAAPVVAVEEEFKEPTIIKGQYHITIIIKSLLNI